MRLPISSHVSLLLYVVLSLAMDNYICCFNISVNSKFVFPLNNTTSLLYRRTFSSLSCSGNYAGDLPPSMPFRSLAVNAFQSWPASKGRRYTTPAQHSAAQRRFNPRLPRKAGATWPRLFRLLVVSTFQSSPASKGRRYPWEGIMTKTELMFQSSPASKGRRYIGTEPDIGALFQFQSSPASKGRRYSPCC